MPFQIQRRGNKVELTFDGDGRIKEGQIFQLFFNWLEISAAILTGILENGNMTSPSNNCKNYLILEKNHLQQVSENFGVFLK
jgi:hypothetical protein